MSNRRRHKTEKSPILPGLEPPIGFTPTPKGDLTIITSKLTAIAIHTVKQFYANPRQLSLFSEAKVDEFIQATGLEVLKRPDSYGVVLNQTESRVFEAILQAFSNTNYLGDEQREKKEELKRRGLNITSQRGAEAIEKAYGNIDKIPVIKVTQAELLRLSGYEERREGDKQDVIEAIKALTTKQYCFYWLRLKKDSKGNYLRDKEGIFLKEEVMEVSTLFRVGYVKAEGENKLAYYEISPSSVILDQVNSQYGGNYFLLIPENWRDEVKQLTGKKASRYTYEFLKWLRLQYELKRRQRTKYKKNFTINRSWEEIAITLKMPETMHKANRKRASRIIQDAYSVAISLGYLLRVESEGVTDILYLNEKYYPTPGKLK